jgi:hypothetical protein
MNYINDDEFARLVSEDVKNKVSNRQREKLMDAKNWGRWQRALILLIENLDDQIADIESDRESDAIRFGAMGEDGLVLAEEADYAYRSRKMKIERFKFHVNRRLDDVTHMIETGSSDEHIKREVSGVSGDANFFRKAIAKHRSLLDEYDLEATEIDRALWRTLDNEWVFEEINESNL